MKRCKLFIILYLFPVLLVTAQIDSKTNHLKTNQQTADRKIKQNEEANFTFLLKKDLYYSIEVEQKGIDLVVAFKDKNGKQLLEQDTPNGMFGPEKFDFSPSDDAVFTLSVKPLVSPENSNEGSYSVFVREAPKDLKKLDYKALTQDFDILRNALIETRVGLWYSTPTEFNKFCDAQRAKITDKMTALEFYQVVAPLLEFTREGHSNIKLSDDVRSFFKQNGRYFPFVVKTLDKKVYLLNDVSGFKTKGLQVSKINGQSIDVIMNRFLSIEPSDGYNTTSKYRWVEKAFSTYYAYFIEARPKSFTVELINPKTNEKVTYDNIVSLTYKDYVKFRKNTEGSILNYNFEKDSDLKIDTALSTATLTINTFGFQSYKDGRTGYKKFLEDSFKSIADNKIRHLIVDIRKNEGGPQGAEDHLLSYLSDKKYSKYKYVEIPAFAYSFLEYTDYRNAADRLEKELREDFYRTNDGRYLAIDGKFKGDSPQKNNFKGDLYILVSGLTFSGGSEFAALAKNYTKAKFIGEETGGGYYGNTSGSFLKYTLPNTNLTGRIPLIKFVVDVKENGIAFGHGLSPDYLIQPTIDEYLTNYDTEMEFAKKLIVENSKRVE